MRSWFFGPAVAASIVTMAPAAAGSSGHPAVAAQQAWIRAYAAADEKALSALVRGDATISESSGTILAKAELLKRAELPAVGLKMSLSQVAVREYGPVVVITALVEELRGPVQTNFRVTETYVRDGPAWQLAASQWTRVLDKPAEIAVEEKALDRLTGNYRTARGVPISVAREGSRLAIAAGGAAATPFVATSPTQFSTPNGRVRWQFITEPNGAVNQAVIVNYNVITVVQRDIGPSRTR